MVTASDGMQLINITQALYNFEVILLEIMLFHGTLFYSVTSQRKILHIYTTVIW